MKKGEFHNADVVIKINLLYEIFVNAPRECFPQIENTKMFQTHVYAKTIHEMTIYVKRCEIGFKFTGTM